MAFIWQFRMFSRYFCGFSLNNLFFERVDRDHLNKRTNLNELKTNWICWYQRLNVFVHELSHKREFGECFVLFELDMRETKTLQIFDLKVLKIGFKGQSRHKIKFSDNCRKESLSPRRKIERDEFYLKSLQVKIWHRIEKKIWEMWRKKLILLTKR